MIPVAVFNDTDRGRHPGCAMVMATLVERLLRNGMRPVLFWPAGKDWRLYREDLQRRCIAAVIVNGEGSIHHAHERPRAAWLVELGTFAAGRGIPAYLVNSTLHANPADMCQALKAFAGLYVRESTSRDELAGHGIGAKLVPDLSLAYPVPALHGTRSGWLATDSVVPEAAEAIRIFSSRYGWRYECINRSGGAGWLRRVAGLLISFGQPGRRRHIASDFLRLIASKEFVLTGRFHAVIACLLTNTPFAALESNTPKITGLLNDVFGHGARVLRAADLTPEIVERFGAWDEDETRMLEDYLLNAKSRIDAMFADIAADVTERAAV